MDLFVNPGCLAYGIEYMRLEVLRVFIYGVWVGKGCIRIVCTAVFSV